MKLKIFAPLTALALTVVLTASGLDRRPAAPATASETEANIAGLTTSLLEHSQFAHHPLDNELAGKFLDRYLDALDPAHVLFLQADVDEFDEYRDGLARATRRQGDTKPARVIFARYLERLGQRAAYVTNELQTAKFDFSGHDVYHYDRANAPRPADLAAAQALWRQQLRAEYLQEKLNDKKPAEIVKTLEHRYGQLARTMGDLSRDEVLEVYLDALAHVYDPHSDYLGHEQMDSFSIAMNLSLFGIGATLQSEDGYCKIRDLVPGGPAARSGLLKPGDRIIAVAQAGQAARGRGEHAAVARGGINSRPERFGGAVDLDPRQRGRRFGSQNHHIGARRGQTRRSTSQGAHRGFTDEHKSNVAIGRY